MTQPPGPPVGPPSYGQPGAPAYGSPYPPTAYQHQQGGMAGWAKVLVGGLIGTVAGVAVLVAVLVVVASQADNVSGEPGGISGEAVFALCVLVPTLVWAPMLLFRATRLWAVGLMIGAGLSSVVLAGACAYIIQGLEGSA